MLGCRFWFFLTQCTSAASGIALSLLIAATGLVPRAVPADDYLDAIEGEAAKLSEESAATIESLFALTLGEIADFSLNNNDPRIRGERQADRG